MERRCRTSDSLGFLKGRKGFRMRAADTLNPVKSAARGGRSTRTNTHARTHAHTHIAGHPTPLDVAGDVTTLCFCVRYCTIDGRRFTTPGVSPCPGGLRGTIVNRTYGTHKKPLDFAIFTRNIRSYLLWSPVIALLRGVPFSAYPYVQQYFFFSCFVNCDKLSAAPRFLAWVRYD